MPTARTLKADEDRGDFNESDTAEPAYIQVLRKFREATDVAGDKRAQWEDVEEVLDALRCNQGSAAVCSAAIAKSMNDAPNHTMPLDTNAA